MYSFQLLFFITLVANACAINNSIKSEIIPAPVNFKYLENDGLNIYVKLINLPPDTMQFLLHVVTDRHPPITLPKSLDNDGLFQVQNLLNVGYVVIDIEIRNKMQEFCAVRNILNGSVSTGADGWSPFREDCLAFNDNEPCTILVDFKKECDSTDLNCYIEDRTLICDSDSLWDVTWSQQNFYTTNRNRQAIFRHAGEKTKSRLKMKIYKFDENTQILTESIYSNKSYNLTTLAQVVNTISVGFVDNSGETITTIPGTIYNKLLDVNRNGSMLCCIYYEISYANGVQYVTRVVANKTLLIYKKDEVNTGVQNNENNDHQKTINSTGIAVITESKTKTTEDIIKHSTNASNPFEDEPTSERTDFVIPEQGLSDSAHTPAAHNSTADIDSHEHKGNSNLLLGVVVAVVLVVIVVLIGTVLVVVKRRTSSSGRPGLQQNTVWSPFYVNNLFREECDREIRNIEEHHYEEIN